RLPMTLAGLGFLWDSGQYPEADRLLTKLMEDPKLAAKSALWRLGTRLAEKRDLTSRGLACLEQALAAEFAHLPEGVDLKTVRGDYGKLLEHYQGLADAMVALQVKPPADFVAKMVSAADRWRALDRDGAAACQAAARILQTLDQRELAWDYLTTPVGLSPN